MSARKVISRRKSGYVEKAGLLIRKEPVRIKDLRFHRDTAIRDRGIGRHELSVAPKRTATK